MSLLSKGLLLLCSFSTFSLASVTISTSSSSYIDYNQHAAVKKFVSSMVKEEQFSQEELRGLFCKVELQHRALKFYELPKKIKKKPAVKRIKTTKKRKRNYGSWSRYEKKLLSPKRITQGIDFMKEHRSTLKRAQKLYGIPPEYITAIIGVESYYGANTGKYPVFDTLCTLAFEENRRNRFFTNELREFLKMTRRESLDPREIKGSYAGAIGLGQFMPSNFEKLGVDFNNDGKVRISEPEDAIGSIANYFNKSGWKQNIPVATRVSYEGQRFKKYKTGYKYKYTRKNLKNIYPKSKSFYYTDKVRLIKLERKRYDELWYGTHNFYVITRYNHSTYYAMAVYQLAKKIRQGYKREYLAMK
ncbi:MAG: lytic murein transglycosylase B [Campylobacterota bacterium]|nr:lytic murein transglycosylase B [Campylobacterota bacterium]